jgi:hypothetical protein
MPPKGVGFQFSVFSGSVFGAVWLTRSGGAVVLQGWNWPVPPHPRPLSPVEGEGGILCGLAQQKTAFAGGESRFC